MGNIIQVSITEQDRKHVTAIKSEIPFCDEVGNVWVTDMTYVTDMDKRAYTEYKKRRYNAILIEMASEQDIKTYKRYRLAKKIGKFC